MKIREPRRFNEFTGFSLNKNLRNTILGYYGKEYLHIVLNQVFIFALMKPYLYGIQMVLENNLFHRKVDIDEKK